MKPIHIIIILIVIFFGNQVSGQDFGKYSSSELEVFARTYMEAKNENMNRSNLPSIQTLQLKFGITDEHLKSLFDEEFSKSNKFFTPEDKLFVEAVKKEKEDFEKNKQRRLEQLCQLNGIESKVYLEILSKYELSTVFQQKLYPYFQLYFKTIGK